MTGNSDPHGLLVETTAMFRTAEDEFTEARIDLYFAVRRAWKQGMTQSEIARITGLNRLTVRRVLGK